MALLLAFRRWWAILVVAVLCLPALGHFLPDLPAPMRTVIAPQERWWEEANRRLDPYINNTFGFRGAVLAAHGAYVRFIGAPRGPNYLQGVPGWLFYTGDNALEQTVGELVRPQKVTEFVDWIEKLRRDVAAWGGQVAVVVPPNGQTVNSDKLPDYVRQQMRTPTEYDLLGAALTKAGIAFTDLRPVLRAANAAQPVYFRYDSHWNQRGAVIGFNTTMASLGRPDLEVPLDAALGERVPRPDGDLQRLTGATTMDPPEMQYLYKGPAVFPEGLTPIPGLPQHSSRFPFPSVGFETGKPGPRIAVLGDSFTYNPWRGLLAARSSAFVWIHHMFCQADTTVLNSFKPDFVIVETAERLFPCRTDLPDWAADEK